MSVDRRTWIGRSTDIYLDELAKYDLNAPREIVAEGIRGRLRQVARALRVTEQSARIYFTEDAIRELARESAVEVAEEQPGADLSVAPRNVPTPTTTLGRTIAGLAFAAQVRVAIKDPSGPDGALDLIAMLANFLSAARSDPELLDIIFLPQAALSRAARYLEATAEMAETNDWPAEELQASGPEALINAFQADAGVLRHLVAEYGAPPGGLTPG